VNCCALIITTNHLGDGIYLPEDDRRHFVCWSDLTKADFEDGYWNKLWAWYENDGYGHVAAYLMQVDLSSFDPKAPPPKTQAFHNIVAAGRAPEDSELADVLDRLNNPVAVTVATIKEAAPAEFALWLSDRKNRRMIPHRLERAGYVAVHNDGAKDGFWKVMGVRQIIYARSTLSPRDRIVEANRYASGSRS
jgi:hypothetical protein